ncbi:MAG: hypothetical protein ACLFUE_10000 [Desulfobacteraceae bacterium]
MLNIDFSIWPVGALWLQIANFLLLLYILNIIAYRPVRRIMSERNRRMEELRERAESMNEDCLENERRLQESIAGARREGFNVKEEIKKQGLDKEKELLAEASSEARERLDRARGDIDSTLGGVRQALQAEVDKFSQELAEKILGRSF